MFYQHLLFANAFNLDKAKILKCGKDLGPLYKLYTCFFNK